VEIKFQLYATDEFLLQILLLAQHVSGHHYAHHQELESIIQVIAACRICCLVFQVVGMMWSWGCSPQTGHTTLSSTLYRQLENPSTKYDRQQPIV
jgi:hypothetical protein